MRTKPIVGVLLGAALVAACGGGGAATVPAATTPSITNAPTTAATTPPAATTAATTPAAATTAPATGTVVTEETNGLEITIPAGWLAVTPESAKDTTAIAALKASAGANAGAVDSLLTTMSQHPEYWFAAINPTNGNVLTGSLRTDTGALAAWTIAQEAALKSAYGTVETTAVTTPSAGTAFTFTSGQYASRLYGFERSNGVAILAFAGPSAAGIPPEWDSIIATFKDEGA